MKRIFFHEQSFAAFAQYDRENRCLEVVMRKDGACYAFKGVTVRQFVELSAAQNKGQHLYHNIIKKYKGEKVKQYSLAYIQGLHYPGSWNAFLSR
ncbi:hypothetical protein GCM10027051_31430 [Niabella terrae]